MLALSSRSMRARVGCPSAEPGRTRPGSASPRAINWVSGPSLVGSLRPAVEVDLNRVVRAPVDLTPGMHDLRVDSTHRATRTTVRWTSRRSSPVREGSVRWRCRGRPDHRGRRDDCAQPQRRIRRPGPPPRASMLAVASPTAAVPDVPRPRRPTATSARRTRLEQARSGRRHRQTLPRPARSARHRGRALRPPPTADGRVGPQPRHSRFGHIVWVARPMRSRVRHARCEDASSFGRRGGLPRSPREGCQLTRRLRRAPTCGRRHREHLLRTERTLLRTTFSTVSPLTGARCRDLARRRTPGTRRAIDVRAE